MNGTDFPKYRWVVIAALCFVQAVAVAVLVAPATIIGDMSDTMGLSLGRTFAATMVFHNVFVALSAFFGGYLVDRFGPYRIWMAGGVFLLLGLLLTPVCGDTFFGMLFIRTLHGIGAGPIMATPSLVVAQWSPLGQRGIIIGIQGTFVSLGAAASMIFVPAVYQISGSWQTALAGLGALPFAAVILSILIHRGPKPPLSASGEGPGKGTGRPFGRRSRGGWKVMGLPSTWAAASCSFWFAWTIRIIYDMIPGYLALDYPKGAGMGPLKAGEIMSGVHMVSITGALLSGVILERWFRGHPRRLVAAGFFISTFLWLAIRFQGVISNRLILSCCMWAGGFMIALTSPLVLAFISKSYPEHEMGKISGLIAALNGVGTLTGLAVGAYALDLTGLYHAPINLISIGAFMGFLSAFFLKEPPVQEA